MAKRQPITDQQDDLESFRGLHFVQIMVLSKILREGFDNSLNADEMVGLLDLLYDKIEEGDQILKRIIYQGEN